MNRAELIIARLTEENDLQRASIQELSKQVAKMQKVIDATEEYLKEEDGSGKQLYSYVRLMKAFAKMETKPEPFKPSSYKDSVY